MSSVVPRPVEPVLQDIAVRAAEVVFEVEFAGAERLHARGPAPAGRQVQLQPQPLKKTPWCCALRPVMVDARLGMQIGQVM